MTLTARLERLDRLESWLKSDDTLILADAAAELDVSLRTIHRDLDMLRDRGVPVEAERGRGGGVRVAHGWGIGRIALTRFEALDLLVGLAVSDVLQPGLQMGHSARISRKLMASFSKADQRKIGNMRKRIRIGGLASQAVRDSLQDPSQQVGDELKEAFALNRVLALNYVDQSGQPSEREFEPHFLMLTPPAWYALGWDHLRAAYRTLRTDRMKTARVTNKVFTPAAWATFADVIADNPTREA